jgi:hypothetical protein
MPDLDRLFSDYVTAAEEAGTPPDPRPFLDRAAPEHRSELARRIDAHLLAAPRRAWDPAAFESTLASPVMRDIVTSVRGASGLWPALLPRLRNAARLRRQEVVSRLAGELGVQHREGKVRDYYHRMEQGLLDDEGVSDTVLEKLAGIVGSSLATLREAGSALGDVVTPDAPAAGPLYTRTSMPDAAYPAASAPAPSAPLADDDWDEVDELFTGRRP